MRIFAISDLHTDFEENWNFLQKVPASGFHDDCLIVAGDISDKMNVIEKTLRYLRNKFRHVSYIPGNHELWVRGNKNHNSIGKLKDIIKLCNEIDVFTDPYKINDLWIVPLYSWYETRDIERYKEEDEYLPFWADFHLCKWDEDIECVSEYMVSLNDSTIENIVGNVISFSHFLPIKELLPNMSRIKFKGLSKVSISPNLKQQLEKINSKIHVFGHTHINCDVTIDGIRYIQNAMRYPRERSRSVLPFEFKLIYDTNQ